MTFHQKLLSTQIALEKQQIDGWLLYDFRRSNDLGCSYLELPASMMLTRRFFYWIPKRGSPVKIVHAIEKHVLEKIPGEMKTYRSWMELQECVKDVLKGSHTVAMEYSPHNAMPYVSKVDGGTLEFVRGTGVEVVSSCDLLQQFTSVMTQPQVLSHLEAAKVLEEVVEAAWKKIGSALESDKTLTDHGVQQFILDEINKRDCESEHEPICAINADSGNPHFAPDIDRQRAIRKGDFILLDLWCKKKAPSAIFADITRVGVASPEASQKQRDVFEVVKAARDAAIALVTARFVQKQPVSGWEVDQAARDVIHQAGFGDYFLHRTGHSIGERVHGNGANIDNFETQDRRHLLPGTCFSIEPGIYLEDFGVRLETDVLIHLDGKVEVTGGLQNSIHIFN